MTASFPHHYKVSLRMKDALRAEGVLDAATLPEMAVGPPPQFGGIGGRYSPEDLLLSAIASCHMTTLAAVVRHKGIPLLSYRATANASLDKTKDGLRFTSLRLLVEATTNAGREAELERAIERAEKVCIVSNALSIQVHLEVVVSA